MTKRILCAAATVAALVWTSAADAQTAQPTQLSACTTINAPGTYVLTKDLLVLTPETCISIQDADSVTLDCQNHVIAANGLAIATNNLTNFKIANCRIEAMSTSAQDIKVQIIDSWFGDFTQNSLGATSGSGRPHPLSINVDQSWGLNFTLNRFHGSVQQSGTFRSVYRNNIFKTVAATSGAELLLSNGGSNRVEYNAFDGSAPLGSTTAGGDDGVVLQDEAGDHVIYNTLSNHFDCAVETTGVVTGSEISFNTASNNTICGVGGWYWSNFYKNQVVGNDITGSDWAFLFTRIYGLRASGFRSQPDTRVQFTGNLFRGNVFRNDLDGYRSVLIPVSDRFPGANNLSAIAGETLPTPSQFDLTSNTFQANDFGATLPPASFGNATAVPELIVDAGGNTCSGSGAGSPLFCQKTPACTGIRAAGLPTVPAQGQCCTNISLMPCAPGVSRRCVDRAGGTPSCQVKRCVTAGGGSLCNWGPV
jgi:hypothetical protein